MAAALSWVAWDMEATESEDTGHAQRRRSRLLRGHSRIHRNADRKEPLRYDDHGGKDRKHDVCKHGVQLAGLRPHRASRQPWVGKRIEGYSMTICNKIINETSRECRRGRLSRPRPRSIACRPQDAVDVPCQHRRLEVAQERPGWRKVAIRGIHIQRGLIAADGRSNAA